MANYGAKVSKRNVSAKNFLTENNKRLFQVISTDGCLIEKEKSSSSSNTNVFVGYRLADDDKQCHPINHWDGGEIYLICENKFDD